MERAIEALDDERLHSPELSHLTGRDRNPVRANAVEVHRERKGERSRLLRGDPCLVVRELHRTGCGDDPSADPQAVGPCPQRAVPSARLRDGRPATHHSAFVTAFSGLSWMTISRPDAARLATAAQDLADLVGIGDELTHGAFIGGPSSKAP